MAWDEIPGWAHDVAMALLHALKERDPYTYGHCRRVAKLAGLLAQSAGLTPNEQRVVEYASLFHDLGKMGIPDRILFKPARLNEEEEEIMRTHPVKSAEIISPLATVAFFKSVVPGIKHHHERFDGMGYPYGISHQNIPLHARIILVVDTYDAMTTSRPYRKGLPTDIAYKELKLFAGRQFDPDMVKVFLDAHRTWGDLEEEITAEFVARRFKKAA